MLAPLWWRTPQKEAEKENSRYDLSEVLLIRSSKKDALSQQCPYSSKRPRTSKAVEDFMELSLEASRLVISTQSGRRQANHSILSCSVSPSGCAYSL